jgi:beta-galactosidase
MWSLGNEEGTGQHREGLLILTAMKAVTAKHDGSRPVSMAPTRRNNMGTGGSPRCDVQGYNYADPGAEAYHKAHPDKPVMGTETVSAVATRGIYVTDPTRATSAPTIPTPPPAAPPAEGWWSFCNARPWLAGGFIWTGFDYRGEPSPNGWPNISSQYGIIDMCGFPRTASSTTSRGGPRSRCCTSSRTGTGRDGRQGDRRLGAFEPRSRWSCSSTARAWARRT